MKHFNNYTGNNLNKIILNENDNNHNKNSEDTFNIIKSIINEMSSQNINQNSKKYLLSKINELQYDFKYKISLIEKKYKLEIDKKNNKINQLEKENNELKKKVIQIKSIV